MKALKVAIVAAVITAIAAPSLAAIYFNDFAATRQTWLGRGYYTSNSNYSTKRFGRVAKGEMDLSLMDFDRAGMFNWVQGIYGSVPTHLPYPPGYVTFGGPITDINQIGNGAVKMTLFMTAYDSWEESAWPAPTVFGPGLGREHRYVQQR